MCVYMYVYMCVPVCVYTCMCICMHICVSVYMYTYTCIYTRVWVYICTHVGVLCLFVLSNPSTTYMRVYHMCYRDLDHICAQMTTKQHGQEVGTGTTPGVGTGTTRVQGVGILPESEEVLTHYHHA